MDLLVYLSERAGDVLSTSDLIAGVWAGRVVGDHAVYRLIQHLRSALEDDPRNPSYIATVPRRGYRLVAHVEILRKSRSLPLLGALLKLQPSSRLIVSAVLVGCILYVALFAATPLLPVGTNLLGRQTIAVLPFVNLSDAASDAYLGEGIASEIIHALSNGSGLRVVARTSSFAFQDASARVSEIAERLNASLVLEGTVRREKDRLRIIAQLVDADSGDYLWSDDFDRSMDELITIERDIALAVAGRVMGEAADTERIAASLPPPGDITAYEYYLLGRERMRIPSGLSREWSLEDANQAIEYFRRAIDLDPGFARAYTGLADALIGRGVIGRRMTDPDIPEADANEARASIERAESLVPGLAEVRASKGLVARVLDRDDDLAFTLYREAIEIDPNLVEPYYRLARGVQGEEGLLAMEKAVELDPLSAELHIWLARLLSDNGRRDEAHLQFEIARLLENASVELFSEERGIRTSQLGEAIHLLTSLLGQPMSNRDQMRIRERLGYYYFRLEDFGKAESMLEATRGDDTDLRIRLALAQGRDGEAAELVHLDSLQPYASLWEALLGHDDHARALTKFDPDDITEGNLLSEEISFGYHRALNAARLELKAGNTNSAEALLAVTRRDLESALNEEGTVAGAYYLLASVAAVMGDIDGSFAALRSAIDRGFSNAWYAERDPNLENLRGDLRFQTAINSMREELARLRASL